MGFMRKSKRRKILKNLSGRSKTLKKYKNRKSPPYPANENCGKKMKGNDGNMYVSKPYILMKNEVCAWRKI
jgi:hypothetical protein